MNPNDVPGAQTSSFVSPAETPTAPVDSVQNQQTVAPVESVPDTHNPEAVQPIAPEAVIETPAVTPPPPIDLVPAAPASPVTGVIPPPAAEVTQSPDHAKPVKPVRNLRQLDERTQNAGRLSQVGAGLEDFVGSGGRKGSK